MLQIVEKTGRNRRAIVQGGCPSRRKSGRIFEKTLIPDVFSARITWSQQSQSGKTRRLGRPKTGRTCGRSMGEAYDI